jgi:hypothetical protein
VPLNEALSVAVGEGGKGLKHCTLGAVLRPSGHVGLGWPRLANTVSQARAAQLAILRLSLSLSLSSAAAAGASVTPASMARRQEMLPVRTSSESSAGPGSPLTCACPSRAGGCRRPRRPRLWSRLPRRWWTEEVLRPEAEP